MLKKGAHVSLIFSKGRMSGVKNKIEQFSSHFNDNNVDVYVLNREFDGVINGVIYINYDNLPMARFARIARFYLIKSLIDFSCYDYVFLRYPLFDFSALLFRKELGKVYFEHHSIELNEIKKAGFPFLFKHVQYFSELLFAPLFLKKCLGHLSVTSQISSHQKSRFSGLGKYIVFSNGISLSDTDVVSSKESIAGSLTNNDSLQVVFVASEFKSWHGLDRLISSLKNYHGEKPIVVNLVGFVSDQLLGDIQSLYNQKVSFILHGNKSKKDTLAIINNSHLGVDSLALDRIGFEVSSTLKSKEYVLLAKPFISATVDQDLQCYEGTVWKKVDCQDDCFDFDCIVSWHESIRNEAISFPKETLSWQYKVRELVKEVTS
ncbi:hypothetical protein AAY72_06330 [Alishewanella sp. WH16-1]|uniref:hypothetical protein n=1 Tax=Alishewanella sp. WH16-1 TaxID=1651088 RepID=UPI00070F27FC|nr:hypothetical protein [Alishewanella sp. WH16-1]KRS21861.1 hypothetical protein AAY72_06330 [Alishewanella sp. WH16-1]